MGIRPVADFETLNYQIMNDFNTSTEATITTETAIGFIPCYRMPFLSLYQIDVLEGLKNIPDKSQDLIIADPPYYKAINESWDKQWKTETEYLEWCKLWFNECVRVLKDTGSFYCYGNFDILSKQKVLIFDKQLNFRQNITLNKGLKSIAGRTSDKLRMFPTASEQLVFYTKQKMNITSPFKIIIDNKMQELGLREIDFRKLRPSRNGNLTGWCSNILKDKNLPTKDDWDLICQLIKIESIDYNDLYEEHQNNRFTFNLPYATTDVWEFTPDKVRYGHPTQKPQDICQRIIKASCNENDNVLIPFAGSGSEMVGCKELKRNCIAFEIESKYIDIIKQRTNDAGTLF